MTRRTRQEIDTMSNLMGEVRPGDEKCSDQTQQVSFGRLGHKGDRDRMSVQVRFRLNLSLEAMRIGPVALKRQPHARSNGECRVKRRGHWPQDVLAPLPGRGTENTRR